MRTPGKIEPVHFFVNGNDPAHERGFIMLAPYSDMPPPLGWTKEAADTLPDVDRLEAQLIRQEQQAREQEWQRDEALVSTKRQEIRDKLYARMTSADSTEYEKEFLRLYLELRNDRRAKHQQAFFHYQLGLWARNNDTPKGRAMDSEDFSVDRIG